MSTRAAFHNRRAGRLSARDLGGDVTRPSGPLNLAAGCLLLAAFHGLCATSLLPFAVFSSSLTVCGLFAGRPTPCHAMGDRAPLRYAQVMVMAPTRYTRGFD